MSLMGRMDLLAALLNERYPKLHKRFEPVHAYIKECLSPQRNLVIHGQWRVFYEDSPSALIIKYSARGKVVSQTKLYSPEQVEALAKDIADTNAWLLKLWQRLPALKKRPSGKAPLTFSTLLPQDNATRGKRVLRPLSLPLRSESRKKRKPQRKK